MVYYLTVRKGDGAGCPNREGRSVPDCNGTICAQMQQDHLSLLWKGPSVPGYMGTSVFEFHGTICAQMQYVPLCPNPMG